MTFLDFFYELLRALLALAFFGALIAILLALAVYSWRLALGPICSS